MTEWLSRSEAETAAIGREIARQLAPAAVVHLSGDLGAGKTTLVRSMAAELGGNPNDVASPSFAIVHEYPVEGKPPLIHIDGYRLSESKREWLEIGLDEILAGPGIKFVEWPKEEFAAFEEQHVTIEIHVNEDDSRTITIGE
jgi:tRNA threonylcarbamoyladenosine biosynthesis protein TsaE